MSTLKCKICGIDMNKNLSHIRKHNLKSIEYYDKYYKKSKEGLCLTCGKETNFKSFFKGYHDFCSGRTY